MGTGSPRIAQLVTGVGVIPRAVLSLGFSRNTPPHAPHRAFPLVLLNLVSG